MNAMNAMNTMNPTNAITINIHDFKRQFSKEYAFLYDNYDQVAGYQEAVEAFDEFCRSEANLRFLEEFVLYRGDLVASDREAAAFMFALEVLSSTYEGDGPIENAAF